MNKQTLIFKVKYYFDRNLSHIKSVLTIIVKISFKIYVSRIQIILRR